MSNHRESPRCSRRMPRAAAGALALGAVLAIGSLAPPARLQPLAEVSDWLENFRKHWAQKFDRLDSLLDELKGSKKKTSPKRKPRA